MTSHTTSSRSSFEAATSSTRPQFQRQNSSTTNVFNKVAKSLQAIKEKTKPQHDSVAATAIPYSMSGWTLPVAVEKANKKAQKPRKTPVPWSMTGALI